MPLPAARELPSRQPLAVRALAAFAAAKLALHLLVLAVTPYGVHRDEFLYFSMGRHLRFWRMDFPPAIAMLANVSRWLFGDSLASVRLFPAIEGTVLLVVAVLIARELGGGRFAQGFTALAVLGGTMFQRTSSLFQPVVLDQLAWTVSLLLLAKLTRVSVDPDCDARSMRRLWVGLGATLGLGLLTKFSILFFGFGVFVALVATPLRRALLTRWPWIAAAIAFAIGSPSIVGQIALKYPVVGQMRDLAGTQLRHVSWSDFVVQQPLLVGPVGWLVAVAGLAALFWWKPLRGFGVLAWACFTPFIVLLLLHGKSYYAGPIYPTLLAAGAVLLERASFDRLPRLAPALRWAAVGGVALVGLIGLPIGVPLLPPPATAEYIEAIGVSSALRTNMGRIDLLPQDFADMLGWEEQARALSRVYHALPAAEQREAVITAANYGEAGAAEFYARRYDLPPVVRGGGTFWYFGPGERPGDVMISIGESREHMQTFYGDVTDAGRILSPWSVREERERPLLLSRRPRETLQQLWPSLRGGE